MSARSLIEPQSTTAPPPLERAPYDGLVVAGWLLVLLAVMAGVVILAYAVLRWLWLAVQ